jgi:hypothetical protein
MLFYSEPLYYVPNFNEKVWNAILVIGQDVIFLTHSEMLYFEGIFIKED